VRDIRGADHHQALDALRIALAEASATIPP
jgi:hypothetical protein